MNETLTKILTDRSARKSKKAQKMMLKEAKACDPWCG
jgi:hypothetical protein